MPDLSDGPVETRLALAEQAIVHLSVRIDIELRHQTDHLRVIEEMLHENQKSIQDSFSVLSAALAAHALSLKQHEANDARNWMITALTACGVLLSTLGVVVWQLITKTSHA